MKQAMKGLFSIALLFSTVAKADINGRSFFLGSNVGNIAGAGLLEQAGKTHRFDADKMYGVFSIHGEYNGSFKSGDLGKYLSPIANKTFRLGKGNNATAVANSATNVYNVFFLLEENYEANITFKPVSKTFTTDLNLFVGLDEFMEGMYFNVELPIVHNKRRVKITETQVTAATNTTFLADYFVDSTTTSVPYTTFVGSMVGDLTAGAGVAANNMKYGKINGSQSKTKVGNVRLNLGYDFVRKENMHLSVALQALVNGNGKSKAVYMFEPSVGTGGRHGIGGRIDGHVRAWEKDDSEINLFLQADLVHLFDATELRSYDMTTKHGVWSRYILFKDFASIGGAPTANSIIHGVNFSTLNAKIGIDLMYDVNLMMAYTNGSMGINVGYGLHGHSKEEHKKWVDSFTTKFLGAWAPDDADLDTTGNAHLALATNIKINGGNGTSLTSATAATSTASNIVVLADLDKNSGLQPSAMVHNVYGDVNYKWEDHEWEPCVGVGGGAAISSNNKGLSQWGVFFHGGICF